MNWRAALVGAVLVTAVGAAVGVLTGSRSEGQTKTVVHTRTEVRTEPTSQAKAPAEKKPTAAADDKFLTDLDGDGGGDNAIYETGSAKIGTTTYASSILVSPFTNDQDAPATVEFPVEAGYPRLKGTLGWSQKSDSSTKGVLTVRKDSARGPELYRRPFGSPAAVAKDVDIALKGAVKVVFVFTTEPFDNYEFPGDSDFVLGDTRFAK